MPLTWSSDFAIKTDHGSAQSAQGPALTAAANETELYMAYLGTGNSNVWFSRCGDARGDFTDWIDNGAVKDGNATVTADSVPAMAIIQGNLSLLVPQKQVCNLLQFHPATLPQWTNQGNTLTLGAGWTTPVTISFGGSTHLFICDEFNNLWWYQSTGVGFEGAPGLLVKEAGAAPSAAVFNNQLFLLYWNTQVKVSALMVLPAGPGATWQDLSAVEFNDGTSINRGAALAVLGPNLYTIYTYGKDPELWYTAFFPTGITQKGKIPYGTPIVFDGVHAKTTSSIAALTFRGKLCVVHKGESDQLYLTYATM
jgi:hypothetical protein